MEDAKNTFEGVTHQNALRVGGGELKKTPLGWEGVAPNYTFDLRLNFWRGVTQKKMGDHKKINTIE